jgi:signal transduction histidine kinase
MNKLSTKLLYNTAGVLLAVAALTLCCYLAAMRWGADFMFRAELDKHFSRIAESAQFDGQGRFDRVVLPTHIAMVHDALRRDYVYRILDDKGTVLASSDGVRTPYLTSREWTMKPIAEVRAVIDGLPMRILTVPLVRNGHHYYIQTARSERFQQILGERSSEISGNVASLAAAVAMLAFGATIFFTFRRAMRPLLAASTVAARIEPARPDVRLSAAGMPDEILPLIVAFNAALARLEDGYRVQQEFLADAAHELKTPLTLMRAQLELTGLADPQSLLLDVDRMGRQVQQLLNLAECSGRQNYLFETVDVVAAVDDAADHLRRLGSQRNVGIDVIAGDGPVLMRADRGALFVLLKNLIENAIQHSPAGGVVLVGVRPGHIAVRDCGGGFPAVDTALLFKRFWRGAHRRDEGAGLGLSICREIASAHGWALSAMNVAFGAEFKLEFGAPAAMGAAV